MSIVDDYKNQLRALRDQPSQANADAVAAFVAANPGIGGIARPSLSVDPEFANAFRVSDISAPYDHHNTHMAMPRAIKTPGDLNTLLQVVRDAVTAGRSLKAMGDGWGFSNAAFTPDWLVQCLGLDDVLPLEADLFVGGVSAPDLVRVQSGITFAKLNAKLWDSGRAVMQQPGFGGLTVMGCASAGGHGSGDKLYGISGYIKSVELVTLNAANQVRLYRIEPKAGITDPTKYAAKYPGPTFQLLQDDSLFHAVRCAQGNLGIIYAMTLQTQPSFYLVERRDLSEWAPTWAGLPSLMNDDLTHSVHVWINPYVRNGKTSPTVVTTKLSHTNATAAWGVRSAGIIFGGRNIITDVVRLIISMNPAALPYMLNTALGACVETTPVTMRCYDALDFGPPNELPVLASSLGFDASLADQVLTGLTAQLEQWTAANQWVSSPIGMRWVKASEDYLSPQYGRDTVMLEMPILQGTPNAAETLEKYAEYMMNTWSARPHWGQRNPMTRAQFEKSYASSFKLFAAAFKTLNPNRFFDGPLVWQLGLRDIANGN